MTANRAWHLLVAILAAIGLGIEYDVTVGGHPGQLAGRTIVFLSFFTILTNALAMTASIGAAIGEGRLHRWAASPGTSTAISVHITVVAVIFQLLLAGLIHLTAIGWWGNMLVHQLVPGLWLVGWIAFAPHGGIDRLAPLRWLIYPLAYTAWVLIHGAITGWYPYPFMDVGKYGARPTAQKMAVIALFFAGLGYAYRWIDGRLAIIRQNRSR
ncbi:Pr6Pr family membrane protein [Sphingomonas chungangi]|uniref:Pr6Pr family membrane protein n=1 Tax=Sphingomonas chungangi TaxID=2683589 RepID=UPI0031B5EB0D